MRSFADLRDEIAALVPTGAATGMGAARSRPFQVRRHAAARPAPDPRAGRTDIEATRSFFRGINVDGGPAASMPPTRFRRAQRPHLVPLRADCGRRVRVRPASGRLPEIAGACASAPKSGSPDTSLLDWGRALRRSARLSRGIAPWRG